MDKNAVISGPGISEDLMLTITRKKPDQSVTIGESLQHDVASFYADVYPWFMNPEIIPELVLEEQDDDEYIDEF